MVLVSIRMRTKFCFKNSSKRCLLNVFLKVILKMCLLCNVSRFYKNAYKVFVLKIVQRCVCKMCFESILKRCILCNGSRFYKNAYKVFVF